MQIYLETLIAREDGVKEVKLYQLGSRFLNRYRDIFRRLFREDRRLTLRRDAWGFGLGLVSTAAFYGAYTWIVLTTIAGAISLGKMTMYLILFRQGQSAVSASLTAISGMYEDQSLPVEPVRVFVASGAARRGRGYRRSRPVTWTGVSRRFRFAIPVAQRTR